MDSENINTILVIDDDNSMLLGIKALLERNNYKAITCEDSRTSAKLAEQSHPDLIICDIMMPYLDGFKIRDAMSANPMTRDIAFLFLTARNTQTDKLRGFSNGADDYITKPFDPLELVARINAILRRQETIRQTAAVEMTRQIERIQSEMSQNVSHELRTPMTQILLSLDMILRNKYDDPDDLKWFVETALSQSYRLKALIDDLIFLNSHDAHPLHCFRQKVDIKLDFTLPISLRQTLYTEKEIQLKVNIAEGINIHASRTEFSHACIHLIDNALKFAPPQSIVLVDLDENGDGGCVLTVTDQGIGIPVELREKVFERYYQISQGITREYGGLGVGLTIAQIIARSLSGDVKILPIDSGCRVQMILPPAPHDMP
jgi:two-component system sensor histidine kinase/response regulator